MNYYKQAAENLNIIRKWCFSILTDQDEAQLFYKEEPYSTVVKPL